MITAVWITFACVAIGFLIHWGCGDRRHSLRRCRKCLYPQEPLPTVQVCPECGFLPRDLREYHFSLRSRRSLAIGLASGAVALAVVAYAEARWSWLPDAALVAGADWLPPNGWVELKDRLARSEITDPNRVRRLLGVIESDFRGGVVDGRTRLQAEVLVMVAGRPNTKAQEIATAALVELGPASSVLAHQCNMLTEANGTWAVPGLITVLDRSTDTDARYWAAFRLPRVAPREDEVVDALIRALDDPAPVIRMRALWSLGSTFYGLEIARPFIEPLQDDPDRGVREAAEYTLRQLD